MEAYTLSISKCSSFTVSSILLLLSMKFLEYTTAFTLGNETDRASLLAFKTEITEDSLGALASWNNSLHICKWAGVACGLKHQRVTSLNLQGLNFNFLGGHISANLSQCSNLTALVLDHSYFVGQIPYELGYLVTSGNSILETISQKLRDLAALGLSDNNLYGEFPPALYNMIYLAANFFTGQIPYSFSNASNLLQLELLGNQFTGQVPFEFWIFLSLVQNASTCSTVLYSLNYANF
ncbi:unnamed protein product [Coffea canephora]|uniref:Leucine-rich repeat-containing N-terminal plant-type domain-containing protein n=1 Tax=Coffea canephora TaxID=49390 RepID=A0A068TRF7_COFCA|nr:unnamed protein product [Coffea canephora]